MKFGNAIAENFAFGGARSFAAGKASAAVRSAGALRPPPDGCPETPTFPAEATVNACAPSAVENRDSTAKSERSEPADRTGEVLHRA